jgi:nuclear transcription Y subunit beta
MLSFPVAASEKCHQEKRKTVNGEDILFAMTSLGFENYAEALKIYLAKYREVSIFSIIASLHKVSGLYPDNYFITFVPMASANKDLQTQSTRGENQQNRPGSQGFGSAAPSGSGAAPNASSTANFSGNTETSNNIMGGQQAESSEHDQGGYGSLYGAQIQTGHNGASGAEGY